MRRGSGPEWRARRTRSRAPSPGASDRIEAGFDGARATRYQGTLDWVLANRKRRVLAFVGSRRSARRRTVPVRGPRLLPDGRRRAAPATRARAGRDADRGDGGVLSAGGGLHPRSDPGRRARPWSTTTSACRTAHQPRAQRQRHRSAPSDGEILVALKPEPCVRRPSYLKTLREDCRSDSRTLRFFLQPADIVSQILNFGLPAPIDIQISGPIAQAGATTRSPNRSRSELAGVPGAVDVHIQQIVSAPRLMVETDRVLAQQNGMTESDMANSLSVSLSGSGQPRPNFWLNYKNGVQYQVVVQTQAAPPRPRWTNCGRTPLLAAGQTSTADVDQPRHDSANVHGLVAQPLQRAARLRRLRQRAGDGPRKRRRRRSTRSSPAYGEDLEGQHDHRARTDRRA